MQKQGQTVHHKLALFKNDRFSNVLSLNICKNFIIEIYIGVIKHPWNFYYFLYTYPSVLYKHLNIKPILGILFSFGHNPCSRLRLRAIE